jgi:hypothetical protein
MNTQTKTVWEAASEALLVFCSWSKDEGVEKHNQAAKDLIDFYTGELKEMERREMVSRERTQKTILALLNAIEELKKENAKLNEALTNYAQALETSMNEYAGKLLLYIRKGAVNSTKKNHAESDCQVVPAENDCAICPETKCRKKKADADEHASLNMKMIGGDAD